MTDRTTPPAPVAGLCADIGGSFIRCAPVAADGTRGRAARHTTPKDDWDALCRILQVCCAGSDVGATLSLAVAGVIAPRDGTALSANIPCFNGRRLAAELADVLQRPVLATNDAACFVLAEAVHGVGRGYPVVFGIVLGTGIGGGLVVDGRLVPGAGEWGHGPLLGHLRFGAVDIPPQRCGCGRHGCLDTLGGARGLERLDTLLHGRARSSVEVIRAWQAGEPSGGATVAAWLEVVAGPLALVVHATGATAVPVTGGLGTSHALVAALDAAVRVRLLGGSDQPLVVPSALGDDAGLIGAALRLRSTAHA